MKRRSSFTRLDAAADGLLQRMARGDAALSWLQARWPRIVGEPLSRKIQATELAGRRLTVKVLDPSWRKAIASALPQLESRIARELPTVKPKITLS